MLLDAIYTMQIMCGAVGAKDRRSPFIFIMHANLFVEIQLGAATHCFLVLNDLIAMNAGAGK